MTVKELYLFGSIRLSIHVLLTPDLFKKLQLYINLIQSFQILNLNQCFILGLGRNFNLPILQELSTVYGSVVVFLKGKIYQRSYA